MTFSRGLSVLVLLAATSLLLGCERRIDSIVDPDLKVADVPVPTQVAAAVGDRHVRLTWTVTNSALVSRYLIYRSDTVGGQFRLVDSTTTTSFDDLQLINGLRYFYQVAARNQAGVEGKASASVGAVPALFSLRINEDDLYTSARAVHLDLTASGASHVRIANDTTQPGSWRAYQATVDWLLEGPAGTKNVFAQFRTVDGAETMDWASDDIIYDDRAEIIALELSDSVLAPGDSLIVVMTTGEAGGIATYSLGDVTLAGLFDDGQGPDTTAADGVYAGVYRGQSGNLFENLELVVGFEDLAGNVAPSFSAPWKVSVRQPPSPPYWISIESEAGDATVLNLNWGLSAAEPFRQLTIRRDTLAGSGLTAPVIAVLTTQSSPQTYRDTGLAPATTYYYTIQVILTNGLESLSAELAGTTAADPPPDPVVLLPPAEVRYDHVSLEWTESQDSDFSTYRLHRAQAPLVTMDSLLIGGTSNQTANTLVDTTVTEATTYYYRVYVLDQLGQATGSNTLAVTTPVNDPPNPVTVAVEPTADSSLALAWTRSDAEDFASYRVFRADAQGDLVTPPPDSLMVGIITDQGSTTYTETGLSQLYYYQVFVYDRAGKNAGSNIVWGPKDFGS